MCVKAKTYMSSTTKKKKFDVIIAGAGPSGSAAAIVLGEKGLSVLLIDKESFPRDKTCGDGITYKALPALKRLGLEDKIKADSPFFTNGYTLVFRDNSKLIFEKPPAEDALAYIISRHHFDNILLEKALSFESVTFLPDTKVTGLHYEGSILRGVEINGEKTEYEADIVMDATGVNSILGKCNKEAQSCALAVRGYYSNVSDLNNTIEVYFSDDILPGYFWIFPTSATTANIGGGTFQNIVEEKKINIKQLLNDFVEKHPVASKKLKNAKLEGILKGGKIPLAFGDFSWSRVRENLLLIGDAGGFVNPITAEGISYAMKTGIYAAETAIQYFDENDKNLETLKGFDALWLKDFSSQYKMGDIFLEGIEPKIVQKYVMSSLLKSLEGLDLNNPATSYEYLVRLKVLTKAF
jgi:menaquinone-9 beta-reductase